MPPSIPESASADLPPVVRLAPAFPRRSIVAAVTGSPAGVIGLVLMSVMAAIALLAPVLTTIDPFALSGPPLAPPSLAHPMGTDALGRDLFSGVVQGARTSLLIAGAAGIIAMVCGVSVGMVAGYRGGVVDDVLMRIAEVFQVLPRFFLVALVIALFGPGLDRMIFTFGLTSWPVLARVVRGEAAALRNLDFVLASEALGASRTHVIRHVLLPHILPSVLVLIGLMLGQVLLVEASLGFLGLGDPNAVTWGMLAGQAQSYLRVAWWLALFPGMAITITVLGFNLLADAVSSALQPR